MTTSPNPSPPGSSSPASKAVLRRFERPASPSLVKFEDIEIDGGAMQLRVKGALVTTTATEFRLLDYTRTPSRPCLLPRPPA